MRSEGDHFRTSHEQFLKGHEERMKQDDQMLDNILEKSRTNLACCAVGALILIPLAFASVAVGWRVFKWVIGGGP